jgi:uncharacterized protein (DUF983 family)
LSGHKLNRYNVYYHWGNFVVSNRVIALLAQRCPVCLQGKVFHSLLGMHRERPHCGLRFERETGYFLNAMFFAYALGFVLIAPTALYLYLRGVSTAGSSP